MEYPHLIEPLAAAFFDLVIPSLPGFAFSGPTADRGWWVQRTARAWPSSCGAWDTPGTEP